MKPLALLAAITLCLVQGSPPADPPIVVSALLTQDGLLFDSPIPLPWDSLLPSSLGRAALASDSSRRHLLFTQRSDHGSTEVPFPLPLPPDLRSRTYYLLDSAGTHELHPTGLLGTARIMWEGESDRVRELTTFGEVKAPAGTGPRGGFVLIGQQSLTLATEPSTLSADALLAPRGGPYTGQGTAFRQIVRQYLIRELAPSAERWVWVQWLPDTAMVEAGCSLRLALFHLDPEPTEVSSLDAECDE